MLKKIIEAIKKAIFGEKKEQKGLFHEVKYPEPEECPLLVLPGNKLIDFLEEGEEISINEEKTLEAEKIETKKREYEVVTPTTSIQAVKEIAEGANEAMKMMARAGRNTFSEIAEVFEGVIGAYGEIYRITEIGKEYFEKIAVLGMTEQQRRKRQLWKQYYSEKAKMTNNERRRRGMAMVRRPKKQQYMIRRRKNR